LPKPLEVCEAATTTAQALAVKLTGNNSPLLPPVLAQLCWKRGYMYCTDSIYLDFEAASYPVPRM